MPHQQEHPGSATWGVRAAVHWESRFLSINLNLDQRISQLPGALESIQSRDCQLALVMGSVHSNYMNWFAVTQT